jgi:hypothetical protein
MQVQQPGALKTLALQQRARCGIKRANQNAFGKSALRMCYVSAVFPELSPE